MVGLTAQRLNPINNKAKGLQLLGLCLWRSFSHVGQITSLLIWSPLLQGIAAVVARWSGKGTDNLQLTHGE